MRESFLGLFPEFKLIKSSELREKTIQTWLKAMEMKGWKIQDLQEMPFTLLLPQTTINLVQHTKAVTLCSLKIAEVIEEKYKGKVSINRDDLLSGALLHDVGKLFEYKKKENKFIKSPEGKLLRHPLSGAAFAYKLGLPHGVLHIIAAHSKEGDGERKTVEAVIVNHADFVNFDALKIEEKV